MSNMKLDSVATIGSDWNTEASQKAEAARKAAAARITVKEVLASEADGETADVDKEGKAKD